jgi:glycosyltransferase involved in cell wall biosynthesis
MYRVLLIGPQPEPITGNSLANQIVLEYLSRYTDVELNIINTSYSKLDEKIGKFSLKKVYHYVKQYKQVWKILYVDKLYITTGQTFFGVLKYFPYLLFAKLLNKEIIVHIHGNYLWKEYESLNGIKKKIFHKILSMSDKGIVLSKSLKKNLTPFLIEEKIYILENFVEDFLFENPTEKKFNKVKIIYLSNLMKEKGIFDLLEALKILQEKNIEFEVKIAGGIDNFFEKKIRQELSKIKNLTYLGLVYNKEKKELLEWGNIFILPTKFDEGQPISILEAMCTGNIILTTSQGGIVDIFKDNKNGFYIEKNSPNSIALKLIDMNSNLKDYKIISKQNRYEAKEKYRVKNFIKKLNNILEN